MEKIERIKALREELTKEVAAVKDTVVADMASITAQINDLVKQGVALADAAGLPFDLSSLTFLPYGSGGLHYNPDGAARDDYYEDGAKGWQSSASSC